MRPTHGGTALTPIPIGYRRYEYYGNVVWTRVARGTDQFFSAITVQHANVRRGFRVRKIYEGYACRCLCGRVGGDSSSRRGTWYPGRSGYSSAIDEDRFNHLECHFAGLHVHFGSGIGCVEHTSQTGSRTNISNVCFQPHCANNRRCRWNDRLENVCFGRGSCSWCISSDMDHIIPPFGLCDCIASHNRVASQVRTPIGGDQDYLQHGDGYHYMGRLARGNILDWLRLCFPVPNAGQLPIV
mmetsp:Transcript_19214/g.41550  ORF Transcript_19214/g.41550 Transcript_19214/m.41550 type:complete len:241 (-) Transcript_19214:543-1265(-)